MKSSERELIDLLSHLSDEQKERIIEHYTRLLNERR